MNRQQFRELEEVQEFVAWAGRFECDDQGHLTPVGEGALSRLSVALNIPRSAKVPGAVQGLTRFHDLTRVYSWRANGMQTGDFAETRTTVAALINGITLARTREAAMAAIRQILWWSGDRNVNVGATPFLESRPDLIAYLDAVKTGLRLETAVVPEGMTAVLGMNSMLTKVHAFNSTDGLPIYDSRVAGAIATLVETWRLACGYQAQPLPPACEFPEVGGGGSRRSVRARYPACIRPSVLHYPTGIQAAQRTIGHAQDWASAKVRLGWLLSELLVEPSPQAIRSLEACLFMAGYDCASVSR